MMKIREGNDVTNRTSAIYVEMWTDLSWLIEQDAVYHQKMIG